jgi:hypothetical protein
VAWFNGLIVDPDAPELDQTLHRRPRDVSFSIDKEQIQPFGLFSSSDDEFRDHEQNTLLKSPGQMQSAMADDLLLS